MRRYRRSRLMASAGVSLIAGFMWLGQSQGWFHQIGQAASTNQPGLYSVKHFVDGDTLAVNMNGRSETIRLIGVDTPETHKPNTPVQCYGPEAASYTKQLIGNSAVRLQADSLSSNRDRYGRLLRYVYLPDGRDVDEVLISQGYGFAYTYFPFTRSQQFLADEQAAQASHKGLWSSCQPKPNQFGGYTSNAQQ